MRGRESRLFKRIIACIFLIVLVVGTAFPVAAVSDNYTRADVPGNKVDIRLSREMYTPTKEISAASFGLEEYFEGITDVYSDNGDIYLLCGEKSRLYHINSDYTTCTMIMVTDKDGNEINYTGARGVYCDKDGDIYIADTANQRVIVTDRTGVQKRILGTPESELIPEDFLYQPSTIAKDNQGYIYILSLGCYYGALLYTPDYEFMGFYGSNTVESNALDTLSYLWERLTSNEAKKSQSVKTLPYSFTDFCFAPDGYMVTSTGALSSSIYGVQQSAGQIKKISNNGANILYKRSLRGQSESSTSVQFLEAEALNAGGVQEYVSIVVSEDDYIIGLDGGHGMIYIYDSECNLMSSFGGGFGSGKKLGTFINPVSITLNGNSVLVADKGKYSITVFEPTEYGNLLRKAQSLYIKGDYNEAKALWEDVLSLNRNCQLAYRGIAMIHYNEGNYKAALEAARIAVDYSVYDMAWQEIITEFIGDHFGLIVLIIAVIIAIIVLIARYMKKKGKKLVKDPKTVLFLKTPFHPFYCFDDIKYKKMGSMKIAIIITILFYVSSVLNVIASGFLYSNTLLRNYNALYTLGGTVGLILLWSVCSWLVSSMFDGKANFKEVYIGSCYSLTPWIVFLFVKVIFSNFLPISMYSLVTGLETVMLIYTVFLLCVAMMKVHEYDFFKFALTSIVVIFFMILVIFVIFLCAILMAQFLDFVSSIYEEIVHR